MLFFAFNIIFCAVPSAFGSLKANNEHCGPDVTQWFALQLDRLRDKSDNDWNLFFDAFDAVLSTNESNVIPSFSQAIISTTFQTAQCPGTSACTGTVTLCGTCLNTSALRYIGFG